MFTGIIPTTAPVTSIEDRPGLRTLAVELPQGMLAALKIGASVAIDGVCLTVTRVDGQVVSFDAMSETQSRTTLGSLEAGERVHVERSAKAGDEVGGHDVSGHVDGTVEVVSVERPENNCIVAFKAPPEAMSYIFPKGFIALAGASLTVVDVDREKCTFTVHLIPETLRVTTFGSRVPGDRVNLEIDRRTQVIVDTVRTFLEEQGASSLG